MKKKRWPRIFGIGALVLILALGLFIAYAYLLLPDVKLQDITAEQTPGRIERGRYLAHHVAVCMDCHSTRDWSRFSGPPMAGTIGKGGEIFDEKMGFPGSYASPNITPYHLSTWSDAEIYRAIVSGVSKDGSPLFPIMPYPLYAKMDTEDILSVVAYLRTLPSIAHEVPRSTPTFPMSLVLHFIPEKAQPQPVPAPTDTLLYGGYLVNAAGCIECHTPVEHGRIIEDLAFSGGRTFQLPEGLLTSTNITPDPQTGIGSWSEEQFVTRFKVFLPSQYSLPTVPPGQMQTNMPWTMYAGMDTTDLQAMYHFLKSVKPVQNMVTRFKPFK